MVDFSEPFRRSLDAAQRAAANRKEIRDLYAQFNEALRSVSDGKAEVVIVPAVATKGTLQQLVAVFDVEARKDLVLAVRNPLHSGFQPKSIARWQQADAGYPCTLIWSDRHASCDSAASLQEELTSLFSSPKVGEAIAAAMRYEPPIQIGNVAPDADAE